MSLRRWRIAYVFLAGILLTTPVGATIVPGAEKNASYPSIEVDRQELERQNNAYSLDRIDLGEVATQSLDPIPLNLRVRIEVDYLFEARGFWKRWTEGADPIGPRKQELIEALRSSFLSRYSALRLCTDYRDGLLKAEILKTLSTLPNLGETEETQTLYAAHVPSIAVIDPVSLRELTFEELEKQPDGWGAPARVILASGSSGEPEGGYPGSPKVQENKQKKLDPSEKGGSRKTGKGKKEGKSVKGGASSKKPKPAKPGKSAKPSRKVKKKG